MAEIKKVFKWWDGSQSEKISAWLEEMEAQGWNLQRVGLNGLRFQFEKGAPRQMSYCVDYQPKADPNYVGIFEDTGWESIYNRTGWYIWRQPYTKTKPEIFTDVDSIIERNKRLIPLLVAGLAAQIPAILLNSNRTIHLAILLPILIIYIPLLGLIGLCLYRLINMNRVLRSKKNIL